MLKKLFIKKVYAVNEPFDNLKEIFSKMPVVDGPDNLTGIIFSVTNVVISIGVALSITAMAYGFIQYTISTGDQDKVKKATDTILWGFISFLVIMLAVAIKTFILNAIGVNSDAIDLDVDI